MTPSPSSSNPQWIYDVFLSFRGPDVRRGFVSHLRNSLNNVGVNIYIDNKVLQKGTELAQGLLRAIEGSAIALVVFSKNYASSTWCLRELEKIMECNKTKGQLLLPVFYNVEPSDVRHQKRTLGEAFAKHEKRFTQDVVSGWRRALTEAAYISGWYVDTNVSDEADMVEKIVEDVSRRLALGFLNITDFPVGLESRVQELIGFTEDQSSRVHTMGIWGMGGSGKTTLAKAIYNQLLGKFRDRSFIENIREVWGTDRNCDLQGRILSDILKTKEKICSIEKGLRGKRVLVVLDDVTELEQFFTLCGGNLNVFRPGSLFIVTTRNRRILQMLAVDHVFKMKELDEKESLELFSWHAFKEERPREDFIELSRNVVDYCNGLPLALEVLGSYLFERTQDIWRSVLVKLRKIPNDQIQAKLRISFDGLRDEMHREIFLDICCFFIGKNRVYVTEILNGCGLHADEGIEILIERSLIKVYKNNKLGMHDLLRDMGREIVRESSPQEPEKRSRLWFQEDVLNVLRTNKGTQKVEGLALKSQTTAFAFGTHVFEKMERLRLLQLDHVKLTGDYRYLSEHLRWVSWRGFSLNYLPDNLYQENLVAIDLKHSKLKQVWKVPQLLVRLKLLNLSHSRHLTNTPDFSKLPNLERLILKDCSCLVELHHSIGDLSKLVLLNLKDCTSLRNLPKDVYNLKSVKTLILSGCSEINELEEDIGQMESLTTLVAKETAIKQVPFSLVRSKAIGYISLCGYEGFARDVFPSLIRSWMSPKMSPLSFIHTSEETSLSLISIDLQNNNAVHLSSKLISRLSNFRSVLVQCDSEFQLTQEIRGILDHMYDVNLTELEETPCASQIPSHSLSTFLIGFGRCHQVLTTLSKNGSQGFTTNGYDILLPGDYYPYRLCYTGKEQSVRFQFPEDCDFPMIGMTMCVVYPSIAETMVAECFNSVMIVNYTKCTIQIYTRDTTISFNNEDWQGLISNLGPGDNVEIFVYFRHGFPVKKTVVYLIYGESTTTIVEMEASPEPEKSKEKKNIFTAIFKCLGLKWNSWF